MNVSLEGHGPVQPPGLPLLMFNCAVRLATLPGGSVHMLRLLNPLVHKNHTERWQAASSQPHGAPALTLQGWGRAGGRALPVNPAPLGIQSLGPVHTAGHCQRFNRMPPAAAWMPLRLHVFLHPESVFWRNNTLALGLYHGTEGIGSDEGQSEDERASATAKHGIPQDLTRSKPWGQRLSGGSVVKTPPASAGDAGLIPGLGRFPWSRK